MDDLISRQQAIVAIEQHKTAVLEGHKWDEGIEYGYAAAHRHIVDIVEQLPTVQPDTTTHDSIPAKTGENDGDRTSDDCISRQQAIDTIKKRLFETAFNNIGIKRNVDDTLLDVAENRLENWFNELPPAQTDIIYCKDCKWYGRADKRRFYRGMDCLQKRIDTIVPDRDFCSRAERRTDE